MNKFTHLASLVLAGTLLTHPAMAKLPAELEALDAQLPGALVNDPTRLDWDAFGPDFKSEGIADPAIPGGGAARRFDIQNKGSNPYTVATNVPLLDDIDRGDTMTVGFWARTISADTADGKGLITVRFQQNASPWPGFADTTLGISSKWEWYEVSGVADRRIKQDQAIVALQLAGAKQMIEIGQTIVVKGAPAIAGKATVPAADPKSDLPEPLQGVGQLLNRPEVRTWGNSGTAGTWQDRDDGTIWLGKATRYTVAKVGENRWDLGTAIPVDTAIKPGDKLIVAIAARTESAQTDDGMALVGIRVQSNEPPYDGFGDKLFKLGPNWQLVRVPFTVDRDMAAGKATIALHFAGAMQAVDIGPVYIFKIE